MIALGVTPEGKPTRGHIAWIDRHARQRSQRAGVGVGRESVEVRSSGAVLRDYVDEVVLVGCNDADRSTADDWSLWACPASRPVGGVDGEDGDAARPRIGRSVKLLAVRSLLIGERYIEELSGSIDRGRQRKTAGHIVGVLGVELAVGSDGKETTVESSRWTT